jgi:hypothetical protein
MSFRLSIVLGGRFDFLASCQICTESRSYGSFRFDSGFSAFGWCFRLKSSSVNREVVCLLAAEAQGQGLLGYNVADSSLSCVCEASRDM